MIPLEEAVRSIGGNQRAKTNKERHIQSRGYAMKAENGKESWCWRGYELCVSLVT